MTGPAFGILNIPFVLVVLMNMTTLSGAHVREVKMCRGRAPCMNRHLVGPGGGAPPRRPGGGGGGGGGGGKEEEEEGILGPLSDPPVAQRCRQTIRYILYIFATRDDFCI